MRKGVCRSRQTVIERVLREKARSFRQLLHTRCSCSIRLGWCTREQQQPTGNNPRQSLRTRLELHRGIVDAPFMLNDQSGIKLESHVVQRDSRLHHGLQDGLVDQISTAVF